ncbi:MAG: hypothetical protein GY870_11035 [archaeon]|nr:hypothetical protein [archaeon]
MNEDLNNQFNEEEKQGQEKQENDPEKIQKEEQKIKYSSLEKALQAKVAEEKRLLGQDLDSNERTVIECFRKPRLILERVYIIFNQTRKTLGMDLKNQTEIREILGSLSEKKYIRIEKFVYEGVEKEAFILTEKGKQQLQ